MASCLSFSVLWALMLWLLLQNSTIGNTILALYNILTVAGCLFLCALGSDVTVTVAEFYQRKYYLGIIQYPDSGWLSLFLCALCFDVMVTVAEFYRRKYYLGIIQYLECGWLSPSLCSGL